MLTAKVRFFISWEFVDKTEDRQLAAFIHSDFRNKICKYASSAEFKFAETQPVYNSAAEKYWFACRRKLCRDAERTT